MYDGLFQGSNFSTLAFCLGLRRALRRFQEKVGRLEGSLVKLLYLEYIDDVVLKFNPDYAHLAIPLLEEALLSINLRLSH